MSMETAQILLGGFGTLAIFSFLIRENPFFRFFEHLFIGVAAGYGTIFSIKDFLWPLVLSPMLGYDRMQFPDGTYSAPYNPWLCLYLLPMAIGLLYYCIYSARWGWLAKIAIGLSLGASAGLSFQGFFAEMLPQIFESFKPLIVVHDGAVSWGESASNWIFVATLLAVMYYFFFSFRYESGALRKVSVGGRWAMMVCFGSFFGSTVMARMALLVERLEFLLNTWWRTLMGVI